MKAKRSLFVSLFMLMLLLCCFTLFVACSHKNNHIHDYKETVIVPTCTERGYTLYKCTCGDNYVDSRVDVLGHYYGDLVVAKPATYTDNGYQAYYHCEACGTYFDESKAATNWDDLVIGALQHTYGTLIAAKDPTCTKDGYKAHYHCTDADCGKYFTSGKLETDWDDLVLEKLGHDYGDLVTANPVSCTQDGNHAYYHCKACDSYFDDSKKPTSWDRITITSSSHNCGNLIPEKPATCLQDGYDAYYYCDKCTTYFDEDMSPYHLERSLK